LGDAGRTQPPVHVEVKCTVTSIRRAAKRVRVDAEDLQERFLRKSSVNDNFRALDHSGVVRIEA
jgi:hypothetical protein